MDIAATIQEALEYRDDPPPNEASTCEWVILPILHKLGYAKRDVVSRDADSAGKFPDYTLLPGDPQHTFYLEAKAWKVDLEDGHANQALNYANQNGRRWVVLTNGHHWRLYDNNICGLPSDKMAAEMHIENENRDQAMRFLEAIGKASVCSDKDMLPQFATEEAERRKRALEEEARRKELEARRSRLSAVLEAELTSQSSPLVAAMLANLRTREGLGNLTADDLVAHFIEKSERQGPTVPPTAPTLIDTPLPPGVMICNPDNPPGLSFTRIISASIGGQNARKWNHLTDAGFRLAWQKGYTDVADIGNWSGANIRPGTYTREGFHPVRGTGLSVPGMSAPNAWVVALRIAKKLRVPITLDFVWTNNPHADYPGRQARMPWTP